MQALSACDLQVVMWLCNQVDAAKLFAVSPCPLSMPVVFSLLQQLSNDLNPADKRPTQFKFRSASLLFLLPLLW